MSPSEQIEFSQSVEGLFIKGLGHRLTPDIRQSLREAGLDLDRPLRPGYPAADFHRWVELLASALHPELERDEALRLVGRLAVTGLEQGLVGKAVAAGFRLIGPRRSLQRVDRAFKNNNNYQVAKVLALSENEARISMAYVFGIPTYYQGVFEASSIVVLGGVQATVEVLPSPPPGTTLKISW
jgi:uncharacterized protein (TIGR02265 family)